jgi:hypothetical protein
LHRPLPPPTHSPLEDEALDGAMAAMDADGSGEVDFEEFLGWWQSPGASAAAAATAPPGLQSKSARARAARKQGGGGAAGEEEKAAGACRVPAHQTAFTPSHRPCRLAD